MGSSPNGLANGVLLISLIVKWRAAQQRLDRPWLRLNSLPIWLGELLHMAKVFVYPSDHDKIKVPG